MKILEKRRNKAEDLRLEAAWKKAKAVFEPRFGPLWVEVVNIRIQRNSQGKRELTWRVI